MMTQYFRWRDENFIYQEKELPQGITNYETVYVDETPIIEDTEPPQLTPDELFYEFNQYLISIGKMPLNKPQ
jgi:hypothetical protein